MRKFFLPCLTLLFLLACSLPSAAVPETVEQVSASATPLTPLALPTETETPTLAPPTETFTPIPPTETSTPTALPFVDSLKAKVTADKLVCRYGPGANYLYLIAFNKTTPIRLIGRAEGNQWVLVENSPQKCWVNSEFVQAEGDLQTLRSVYPDGYKIPVSPYYGPTSVTSAKREGEKVIVAWGEVIVSPGKYEDENMFPYIVEVWRCENNEMIFETLGSRVPFISFTDQAGCDFQSHGRVYVQEKHGYAGPSEIPWPPPQP